ncbi:hypothetical protein ACQP2P_00440 [Dactylosporangium sp. CA-139114]|uniref:hypothetical protein n=1 Tax=Dactylosporangium sp. CA-139114 TaxID=3239931 RepID=UPI003D98FCF0
MQYEVPDAIKRITKEELIDLTAKARSLHLGAGRRPDWLMEHLPDSARGFLRAVLRERTPQLSYRCLILVRMPDKEVEHFSLDLLAEDFDQLPDVDGKTLLRLTRWALSYVPINPLPPET